MVAAEEYVRGDVMAAGLEANWTYSGQKVYAFAAVLNATTQAMLSVRIANTPPIGSLVNVEVELTGIGIWTCFVNGTPLLSTTFNGTGAAHGSSAAGILAEYNNTPWFPGEVMMPQALELLTPIGWYMPERAYAQWASEYAAPVNISGQSINATLGPDEFEAGTDVRSASNGTLAAEIWSEAPTKMALLQGTMTPSSVVGGNTANLTWQATSALTGNPLSGVEVDYWSSQGGAVGEGITNPGGWVNVTLPTTSVIEPHYLNFTALILNASYFGSGNASLQLLPVASIGLGVVVTSYALSGKLAGTYEIVVQILDAGVGMNDVPVLLEASVGGGTFSPFAPWVTNTAGYAYGNYTTPPVNADISVWVNVSKTGYEGGNYTLVIASSGTNNQGSSSSSIPWWVYAIVAAAAVIVIAVVVVNWRRKKAAEEQEDEEEADKPEMPEGKEKS
jgi:hypothetical protein